MHFNLSLRKFKEYVQRGLIGFKEETEKPIQDECSFPFPSFNQPSQIAIISRSELDFISRCILDYKNIETGGQLFGYWSADGTPIVLYAIGPGKNANHESAFFNQDIDYLKQVGKILHDKYGLHHIGEWHSHHQLGLAHPSGHDANNMHTSISRAHLGRFLLCIGNCTESYSTLNAFNFVEDNHQYVKAKWLVKEFEGLDYRSIIDSQECDIIIQPRTRKAKHGKLYLQNEIQYSSQNITDYEDGYWYNLANNKKTFASIVKKIIATGSCDCQPDLDENKYVHLKLTFSTHIDDIMFPKYFPHDPPIVYRETSHYKKSVTGKWEYDGDLSDSFFKFYNSTYEAL